MERFNMSIQIFDGFDHPALRNGHSRIKAQRAKVSDLAQRRWRLAFLRLVQADLVLNQLLEDSDAQPSLVDQAWLEEWRAERRLDRIERETQINASYT